jgi:hypothetical protein
MRAESEQIKPSVAAWVAGFVAAFVGLGAPFVGLVVLLESWGYTGLSMSKGWQNLAAALIAFSFIGVVITATHYCARAITHRGWF